MWSNMMFCVNFPMTWFPPQTWVWERGGSQAQKHTSAGKSTPHCFSACMGYRNIHVYTWGNSWKLCMAGKNCCFWEGGIWRTGQKEDTLHSRPLMHRFKTFFFLIWKSKRYGTPLTDVYWRIHKADSWQWCVMASESRNAETWNRGLTVLLGHQGTMVRPWMVLRCQNSIIQDDGGLISERDQGNKAVWNKRRPLWDSARRPWMKTVCCLTQLLWGATKSCSLKARIIHGLN